MVPHGVSSCAIYKAISNLIEMVRELLCPPLCSLVGGFFVVDRPLTTAISRLLLSATPMRKRGVELIY